jgi:CxxC motif-containing protein (DUF1111 family)
MRHAMSAEMGVTVPVDENTVFGATADDDNTPDLEMPLESLDALEFFLVSLSAPPRGPADGEGEQAFVDLGCAGCHTPVLDGRDGPVALYSDLLLHDVASAEFVGISDGTANGRQFRTPPLWGVSETAPYMYDGAASTLRAAIEAHAGEATASIEAWSAGTTLGGPRCYVCSARCSGVRAPCRRAKRSRGLAN